MRDVGLHAHAPAGDAAAGADAAEDPEPDRRHQHHGGLNWSQCPDRKYKFSIQQPAWALRVRSVWHAARVGWYVL